MRRATALLLAVALGGSSACAGSSSARQGADGADERRSGRATAGATSGPGASGTPGEPGATAPAAVDPDTPTSWGPTEGELARARSLVASMSLPDRVATVLMPGFWGHDGAAPSAAEASLNDRMHGASSATEALAAHPFGGVFLRPEVIADAGQVDRLAAQLHDAGDGPGGLPLLVSMDQEGGVVQRLKDGVAAVPSAASVGASGDRAYARKVARDNGRTLRGLGVTMVLAPVADVDPDGVSVIGSRSYSTDLQVAADMVVASVRGYLRAGVIPAVKHFPGLGTVAGDSHHALPVQPKSVRQLVRTDLVPFAAAVAAGAPAIMTGHVAVPAVEPGLPTSLSPEVIARLLRGKLGFEGLVVTDSQGMGPVNGPYNSAEGAVRSLVAGNDLVLNSPVPRQARTAVRAAVGSGRLPEQRLDEAATRVLAVRMLQARLASSAT